MPFPPAVLSPAPERRPHPVRARRAGVLLPAAFAAGAAAFAAADLLTPGYSPVSETISRYVNGDVGWLVTAALLGIGLASAMLVVRLGCPGVPRPGRWLLAVWAGGVLVAGIFPADPPGQWGRPSTPDLVHGSAATLAFVALAVAARVLHPFLAARWPAGRSALRAAADASMLTTAALLVFLADVMNGPSLGLGSVPTLVGLVERLAVTADLTWLALAALSISRPLGKSPGLRA